MVALRLVGSSFPSQGSKLSFGILPWRSCHRTLLHNPYWFLSIAPQLLRYTNYGIQGCLSSGLPNAFNGKSDESLSDWHSTIATKFIDENLINAFTQTDGLKRQIVLLTDGMDQRPYRLPWPPATVIFHVTFGHAVQHAKNRSSGNGMGLPKACLLRHVSAELGEATDLEDGWTERLLRVGYQGDKPSIWVMQGLKLLKSSRLEHILMCVSSLAMKGSLCIGELSVTAIDCMHEEAVRQQVEKILTRHGFRVKSVLYEEIGRGEKAVDGVHVRIPFVAEQLRLSDEQVMKAMRAIEFAEEGGDEETFEDW